MILDFIIEELFIFYLQKNFHTAGIPDFSAFHQILS